MGGGEITDFEGRVVASSSEGVVAKVGARVRRLREMKGMPRRALAERSGVSLRYLAQLESGDGNISIALLQKVCEALDARMEWVVGAEDPWRSETLRLAELFGAASSETRRRVMDLLKAGQLEPQRRRRIGLIGLRGAGTSTLGRKLGEALGLPFRELNRDIEEQAGMPVADVIALYGQEGYRRLERQAIERVVATDDGVVLAVAGGIVSDPPTFDFLMRHFHTVWLRARPETHMQRVAEQGDVRPMAGNPQAMDELKSILTSREALYAEAEAMIDTEGKSEAESARELLAAVKALGLT